MTTKRHGHPNILLITDIDRGTSRKEIKRRYEQGEYAGGHRAYLVEAGIISA